MATLNVRLFNTRTREVEDFVAIRDNVVKMYCCGPTVYNFAHIGNLRTYFFEDTLRRVLELAGYDVTHVMNITDVGHLQSIDDEGKDESGQDKMAVAAARENKSPWDIARAYEDSFMEHISKLNVKAPTIICRATEHIPQMIKMIEDLIVKGHAYESEGNVYFDVASFPSYANFARLKLEDQAATERVEFDTRKKNQHDFALWFGCSKFPNQIMKWPSPWGEGFPGWHIECSAMASHYLGSRFDIHCGGIDHIPVHHTNEIAQSEGCFGTHQPWVNYWLHGEFLQVDSKKMSKSSGDFLHLDKLIADGYDPLDYRYLLLTAHYRSHLRFSYESLDHARNTRHSLKNLMNDWSYAAKAQQVVDTAAVAKHAKTVVDMAINDLATPEALAYAWGIARDASLNEATRLECFKEFDKLFGLSLVSAERVLTPELQAMLDERETARVTKNWAESDRLRDALLAKGVKVKDRKDGVDWEYVS